MAGRALWWVFNWSWRTRGDERKRRLYGIWATLQEGRREVRARESERERQLGLPLDNDNVHSLQRQFPSLDLTDRLSQIACPTLIMYGTRDAAAVWGADLYRTHLARAKIASFDDIGHDPLFETPHEAASTIQSFLR
jgi:pimeloyl-ACP methyl ester carboxylesterase